MGRKRAWTGHDIPSLGVLSPETPAAPKPVSRRFFIASMLSLGFGAAFAWSLGRMDRPPISEEGLSAETDTPSESTDTFGFPANTYLAYSTDKDMVKAKLRDPDLVLSCLGQTSMLVLGSSEMSRATPNTMPTNLFYGKEYDRDFCLLGEAGTQSLWAAMEVAALAPQLKQKKIVLVLSQLWATYGLSTGAFQNHYSSKVMKMMMDNTDLAEDTVTSIVQRAATGLAGSSYEEEAKSDTPLDTTNAYASCVTNSLQIDEESSALTFPGADVASITQSVNDIDWDALLAQASVDGASESSNNAYGILNDEYEKKYASDAEGCESNFNWAKSTEYGDLELFLKVCSECGIEPLLVMTPVKGAWSDYTGITDECRQAFYDHIRALADGYSAQLADFSAYEDDLYFMDDRDHIGWRGWLYVEKAVIDFYEQA